MSINHIPQVSDRRLDAQSWGDFQIIYVTKGGKDYCRCTCPPTVKTLEQAKEWALKNFRTIADSRSREMVGFYSVDRF